MKIVLLVIGKTNQQYLIEGILKYQKRLQHYAKFEIIELQNIKNSKKITKTELAKMEGKLILNKLEISDYIILLDDKGKDFSSLQFSKKLTSLMQTGKKRLVFIVGGAYGFSNDIFSRCNERLSLSRMTFSHQMVRLFFVEQIYRAFTILNNEPYHHK